MSAIFSRTRLPVNFSLYLVADRTLCHDEELFFSKIRESVKGGVSCVQLRDHRSDFAAVVKTAACLKKMLSVPCMINALKPIEVAQAIDAVGVFLEEKVSYMEARKQLGDKAIIGISIRTIDEIMALGEIDYLSIKISPSRVCPKNDALWDMDGLRKACVLAQHPILAVGGIDLTRVEMIYKVLRDQDGIAMRSCLMEAEDLFVTAQKIQAIRQKVRSGS